MRYPWQAPRGTFAFDKSASVPSPHGGAAPSQRRLSAGKAAFLLLRKRTCSPELLESKMKSLEVHLKTAIELFNMPTPVVRFIDPNQFLVRLFCSIGQHEADLPLSNVSKISIVFVDVVARKSFLVESVNPTIRTVSKDEVFFPVITPEISFSTIYHLSSRSYDLSSDVFRSIVDMFLYKRDVIFTVIKQLPYIQSIYDSYTDGEGREIMTTPLYGFLSNIGRLDDSELPLSLRRIFFKSQQEGREVYISLERLIEAFGFGAEIPSYKTTPSLLHIGRKCSFGYSDAVPSSVLGLLSIRSFSDYFNVILLTIDKFVADRVKRVFRVISSLSEDSSLDFTNIEKGSIMYYAAGINYSIMNISTTPQAFLTELVEMLKAISGEDVERSFIKRTSFIVLSYMINDHQGPSGRSMLSHAFHNILFSENIEKKIAASNIARLLLDHGADSMVPSYDGKITVFEIIDCGNVELITLLLHHPNFRFHKSILDYANSKATEDGASAEIIRIAEMLSCEAGKRELVIHYGSEIFAIKDKAQHSSGDSVRIESIHVDIPYINAFETDTDTFLKAIRTEHFFSSVSHEPFYLMLRDKMYSVLQVIKLSLVPVSAASSAESTVKEPPPSGCPSIADVAREFPIFKSEVTLKSGEIKARDGLAKLVGSTILQGKIDKMLANIDKVGNVSYFSATLSDMFIREYPDKVSLLRPNPEDDENKVHKIVHSIVDNVLFWFLYDIEGSNMVEMSQEVMLRIEDPTEYIFCSLGLEDLSPLDLTDLYV